VRRNHGENRIGDLRRGDLGQQVVDHGGKFLGVGRIKTAGNGCLSHLLVDLLR
jgi:hypothetical protein